MSNKILVWNFNKDFMENMIDIILGENMSAASFANSFRENFSNSNLTPYSSTFAPSDALGYLDITDYFHKTYNAKQSPNMINMAMINGTKEAFRFADKLFYGNTGVVSELGNILTTDNDGDIVVNYDFVYESAEKLGGILGDNISGLFDALFAAISDPYNFSEFTPISEFPNSNSEELLVSQGKMSFHKLDFSSSVTENPLKNAIEADNIILSEGILDSFFNRFSEPRYTDDDNVSNGKLKSIVSVSYIERYQTGNVGNNTRYLKYNGTSADLVNDGKIRLKTKDLEFDFGLDEQSYPRSLVSSEYKIKEDYDENDGYWSYSNPRYVMPTLSEAKYFDGDLINHFDSTESPLARLYTGDVMVYIKTDNNGDIIESDLLITTTEINQDLVSWGFEGWNSSNEEYQESANNYFADRRCNIMTTGSNVSSFESVFYQLDISEFYSQLDPFYISYSPSFFQIGTTYDNITSLSYNWLGSIIGGTEGVHPSWSHEISTNVLRYRASDKETGYITYLNKDDYYRMNNGNIDILGSSGYFINPITSTKSYYPGASYYGDNEETVASKHAPVIHYITTSEKDELIKMLMKEDWRFDDWVANRESNKTYRKVITLSSLMARKFDKRTLEITQTAINERVENIPEPEPKSPSENAIDLFGAHDVLDSIEYGGDISKIVFSHHKGNYSIFDESKLEYDYDEVNALLRGELSDYMTSKTFTIQTSIDSDGIPIYSTYTLEFLKNDIHSLPNKELYSLVSNMFSISVDTRGRYFIDNLITFALKAFAIYSTISSAGAASTFWDFVFLLIQVYASKQLSNGSNTDIKIIAVIVIIAGAIYRGDSWADVFLQGANAASTAYFSNQQNKIKDDDDAINVIIDELEKEDKERRKKDREKTHMVMTREHVMALDRLDDFMNRRIHRLDYDEKYNKLDKGNIWQI